MARKNDVDCQLEKLSLDDRHSELSGADIESVVLTARRLALLEGRTEVSTTDIETSLGEFIPSAQGLEKTLQEVAAVLECTQLDFLNEQWRTRVEAPEGRSQLQQTLTRTRAMVESL